METVSFNAGEKLIDEGQKVRKLYVILSGTVEQTWRGIKLNLGPGTVAGLSDALNGKYEADYVALSVVNAVVCDYNGIESLNSVFSKMPVYIFGFSKGAFRQCRDVLSVYDLRKRQVEDFYDFVTGIYSEYSSLCKSLGVENRTIDLLEELTAFDPGAKAIQKWEHDYIDCLNSVDNKEIENIYGKSSEIAVGVVGISCGISARAIKCAEIMQYYLAEFSSILLSQSELDMFLLLYELNKSAHERKSKIDEASKLMKMLYKYLRESNLYDEALIAERWQEYSSHDFSEDAESYDNAMSIKRSQLKDTFGHICEFAEYDKAEADGYKRIINDFLALTDREGKEDNERRARKSATDLFYKIYERVFFRAVELENEIDPIILSFLHFGLLDSDALGIDLTEEVVNLANMLQLCNEEHVFTIFSWLKAVYEGRREPSKNELDLDYRGFVIEERKNGNIKEEDVADWMSNNTEKVRFEMNNFFKSSNRTTSGKMTSFCPILTADSFGAEPIKMLLTSAKLHEAMEKIEEVDFRIFLRERFYTDMEANIKSEPYLARVEPDIILLPNSGMRAMMWQECGGIKIDTPGRFVFPLFTLDDLDRLMIYCCGSFRWEICRREQGARWNDIASDCLTSDFYDYFTFYRKNKDLSADNKEKIKTLLKSSRNNMREAFTKQYNIWVNFEAKGSLRLNKSERNILAKYCPFAKQYRDKVAGHPMYEQAVSKYNIKTSQTLHHMKSVFDKVEKNDGEIPEEIKQGMRYLMM